MVALNPLALLVRLWLSVSSGSANGEVKTSSARCIAYIR
jgi:hypothetical protein